MEITTLATLEYLIYQYFFTFISKLLKSLKLLFRKNKAIQVYEVLCLKIGYKSVTFKKIILLSKDNYRIETKLKH